MPTKELSIINYNGDDYIIVDSTASAKFSAQGHHHTISEIDGEIAPYSFTSPIIEDEGHVVSLSTVPVNKGGTGSTSLASGQVLIGNGQDAVTTRMIDTTIASTSTVTNLITSGAVKAALDGYSPIGHQHTVSQISDLIVHTFTSPLSENATTHEVSLTTVPVTLGGTGATSLASGKVLIGNGTSAVSTRDIASSVGTDSTNTNLVTAGAVYNAIKNLAGSGHHHTSSQIDDLVTYTFATPLSVSATTTSYLYKVSLNTVPVSKGGTGVTTITSGEVMIGAGGNAITTRGIATSVGTSTTATELITAGAVYEVTKGLSGVGHKHTTADITDLITYSFSSPLSADANGNVTLGTVPVSKGGTGVTSWATNKVVMTGTTATADLVTRDVATSVGTSTTATGLVTAGAVYNAIKGLSSAGHHHTVSEIDDLPNIVSDVKINGTSITSNGIANFATNTAYNATNNKIATMNDIEITTITYSLRDGSSSDYEMLISSVAAANYAQNIMGEAY